MNIIVGLHDEDKDVDTEVERIIIGRQKKRENTKKNKTTYGNYYLQKYGHYPYEE